MLWEAPLEIRDLFIHLLGAPLAKALRGQPSALRKITTPSEGSPCPMPDRHSYKKLASLLKLKTIVRTISVPPEHSRKSAEVFNSTIHFSLCSIPLPSPPCHRCQFQEHSLIDILNDNVPLRDCFLENPKWKSILRNWGLFCFFFFINTESSASLQVILIK